MNLKSLLPILLSMLFYFFQLAAATENLKPILDKYDKYAEEQRKAWNVQGMAIAIIKDDQILFVKGYGQRGLQDKQPVDENTIFQIGSLTKAFTAALTAIGVEKGWFKWDDKVIEHLPEFHLEEAWVAGQFQIQDLLAQRSGLPPYAGDSQVFLGFTLKEMIQNLRFIKTSSSFRSQFAYQNIFFGVAGQILEAKSKIDFPNLLKLEIFGPLGMHHTTASLQEYLASENRAEWLSHAKDGSITRVSEDFAEANWNYTLGAAGGINSNVKDLANWMILQANEGKFKEQQLIPVDQMKKMTRPMVYAGETEGINKYYALGWLRSDYSPYPIVWHNGSTLGTSNMAAFIPEEKLAIVILTNGHNTNLAPALTFQFFDMFYKKPDRNWGQKLLAKEKEAAKKATPKVESPSQPMPLSSYVGDYYNPAYGKATVKETNKELHIILGKNHTDFALKPWDRDIFTTTWTPVEDEEMKVLFIEGDNGKIVQFQIDLLVDEGCGEFDKKESEEKAPVKK